MAERTFGIRELAQEFDVTPRAIRFYESKGLLAPRRKGQQRIFSRRDRTRLKLILRGKRLGFTLDETREVFELYDALNGEKRQLERLLEIQAVKRAELNRKRRDLDAALGELDDFERQCRELLRQMKGERTASS